MEARYKYLKLDLQDTIIDLILQLEWEDVFETVKMLPEDIREHVQNVVEEAYECVVPTEDIKCEGEEREEIINNIITQINRFYKLQIKMRELNGWEQVNRLIRLAPKCRHEEKIVISSYCPSCKKIEHNNHSCNKCTTSEDLKRFLRTFWYDPEYFYFVKTVCKACKIWKIQNETSAAA